jgi:hypothetical protein
MVIISLEATGNLLISKIGLKHFFPTLGQAIDIFGDKPSDMGLKQHQRARSEEISRLYSG